MDFTFCHFGGIFDFTYSEVLDDVWAFGIGTDPVSEQLHSRIHRRASFNSQVKRLSTKIVSQPFWMCFRRYFCIHRSWGTSQTLGRHHESPSLHLHCIQVTELLAYNKNENVGFMGLTGNREQELSFQFTWNGSSWEKRTFVQGETVHCVGEGEPECSVSGPDPTGWNCSRCSFLQKWSLNCQTYSPCCLLCRVLRSAITL